MSTILCSWVSCFVMFSCRSHSEHFFWKSSSWVVSCPVPRVSWRVFMASHSQRLQSTTFLFSVSRGLCSCKDNKKCQMTWLSWWTPQCDKGWGPVQVLPSLWNDSLKFLCHILGGCWTVSNEQGFLQPSFTISANFINSQFFYYLWYWLKMKCKMNMHCICSWWCSLTARALYIVTNYSCSRCLSRGPAYIQKALFWCM